MSRSAKSVVSTLRAYRPIGIRFGLMALVAIAGIVAGFAVARSVQGGVRGEVGRSNLSSGPLALYCRAVKETCSPAPPSRTVVQRHRPAAAPALTAAKTKASSPPQGSAPHPTPTPQPTPPATVVAWDARDAIVRRYFARIYATLPNFEPNVPCRFATIVRGAPSTAVPAASPTPAGVALGPAEVAFATLLTVVDTDKGGANTAKTDAQRLAERERLRNDTRDVHEAVVLAGAALDARSADVTHAIVTTLEAAHRRDDARTLASDVACYRHRLRQLLVEENAWYGHRLYCRSQWNIASCGAESAEDKHA